MVEKRAIVNKRHKRMIIFLLAIIFLIMTKVIWVNCATSDLGSFEGERKEIIRRANFLTSKVATTPQKLLDKMPSGIGEQFQGEWAIYSCSMTCAALANIAILYPKNKELSIKFIHCCLLKSPEMPMHKGQGVSGF